MENFLLNKKTCLLMLTLETWDCSTPLQSRAWLSGSNCHLKIPTLVRWF